MLPLLSLFQFFTVECQRPFLLIFSHLECFTWNYYRLIDIGRTVPIHTYSKVDTGKAEGTAPLTSEQRSWRGCRLECELELITKKVFMILGAINPIGQDSFTIGTMSRVVSFNLFFHSSWFSLNAHTKESTHDNTITIRLNHERWNKSNTCSSGTFSLSLPFFYFFKYLLNGTNITSSKSSKLRWPCNDESR